MASFEYVRYCHSGWESNAAMAPFVHGELAPFWTTQSVLPGAAPWTQTGKGLPFDGVGVPFRRPQSALSTGSECPFDGARGVRGCGGAG